MDEFLQSLKSYWTTYAFGLVSIALTGRLYAFRKKLAMQRKKQCALEIGLQALLRDRIIQAYEHYHGLGYITFHGLESVNSMWASYDGLDGNGSVTDIVTKMRAMDIHMD
jgi:hypothetical protein